MFTCGPVPLFCCGPVGEISWIPGSPRLGSMSHFTSQSSEIYARLRRHGTPCRRYALSIGIGPTPGTPWGVLPRNTRTTPSDLVESMCHYGNIVIELTCRKFREPRTKTRYFWSQSTSPRTRYEGAHGIAWRVRACLWWHARLPAHTVHGPDQLS